MTNSYFDTALQIAAFKGIAEQLLENNLITQNEFHAIQKKLKRKERILIDGRRPKESHTRHILSESQAQNGLDSFGKESDD